jgi:DNA-binding CsgD family transcriptional regulator
MTATARRYPLVLTRRPAPKPEREVSDMAHEMLTRILGGLRRVVPLSERERAVLYQVLFGRTAEAAGARLGLRETTVHKHMHRVYARTGTSTRRELLELGLSVAKQHELRAMSSRRVLAA